jgi:hypothetical protein
MAQRPYRLLGLPETRSLIFLINNSPDQAEGYLDYLQPQWMIEAGNFSHAIQIIKVLERHYNTHDQAAKSALALAFHSLKQETGESGAEFVDRINAAAMKLEKAGEVVSDAAKLTRLIHPNQGLYKLGMTIYTTPDITFDKASGLFEGMEHSGLAPVPPSESSAQYVNAIFCNYCRKNGHKTKICRKKKRDENNKKRKTSSGSSEYSSEDFSGKRRNFPCCICDAKDNRSHECPRSPQMSCRFRLLS